MWQVKLAVPLRIGNQKVKMTTLTQAQINRIRTINEKMKVNLELAERVHFA